MSISISHCTICSFFSCLVFRSLQAVKQNHLNKVRIVWSLFLHTLYYVSNLNNWLLYFTVFFNINNNSMCHFVVNFSISSILIQFYSASFHTLTQNCYCYAHLVVCIWILFDVHGFRDHQFCDLTLIMITWCKNYNKWANFHQKSGFTWKFAAFEASQFNRCEMMFHEYVPSSRIEKSIQRTEGAFVHLKTSKMCCLIIITQWHDEYKHLESQTCFWNKME